MPTKLNAYISFGTNAREAMEFYRSVFGGNLAVSTFAEFGNTDPAVADGVMHATLETETGLTLMAADTPPGMPQRSGDNISLSLSGDDAEELRGYWEKLSEGGMVLVPLEPQMWGDVFGMCVDKFGIGWMVNIATPQA